MFEHSLGQLTERGGELLHPDPVQQRLPRQCEFRVAVTSRLLTMSRPQIEDSYKHPRHRRFPSQRFQEEEPAHTGKFEVNSLSFLVLKCIWLQH